MPEIRIEALIATAPICAQLSAMLTEAVAEGGSVGFMHPLAPDAAGVFWDGALAAAAHGERIVLGAWIDDELAGTVSVLLACPPNQPHRADIAKLMTRVHQRGRGVATALMHAAQAHALAHGKTLLVLDTATQGGAADLYQRLGYSRAGEIPGYALKPHGGLTGTLIYWKNIGAPALQQTNPAR